MIPQRKYPTVKLNSVSRIELMLTKVWGLDSEYLCLKFEELGNN